MTEIGLFEAKNKLSALIDRVEAGEEVVITRRGKAVAKLVPATTRTLADQERARAAIERIRARARALKLSPAEVAEMISWRREGLE